MITTETAEALTSIQQGPQIGEMIGGAEGGSNPGPHDNFIRTSAPLMDRSLSPVEPARNTQEWQRLPTKSGQQ